jgi:hypothetical protein
VGSVEALRLLANAAIVFSEFLKQSLVSHLAVGHDGTIYCFYEQGGDGGHAWRYLTLARFNRERVSQQ